MNTYYPVFVMWMDALDWILDAVEKYPKSVRFTVSGRIANLTLDVMEKIVEAVYTKDRSGILQSANLNIEKLRVLFRISFKRRYISLSQYEHVSNLLNETGRMIGGWKKGS